MILHHLNEKLDGIQNYKIEMNEQGKKGSFVPQRKRKKSGRIWLFFFANFCKVKLFNEICLKVFSCSHLIINESGRRKKILYDFLSCTWEILYGTCYTTSWCMHDEQKKQAQTPILLCLRKIPMYHVVYSACVNEGTNKSTSEWVSECAQVN